MSNSTESLQSNFESALLAISLDSTAQESLQSQLTKALRTMIVNTGAGAGRRLPPSRRLAEELSVSRTTIQLVYDQLIAEGYLAARVGSGTYIPDDLPHLRAPPAETDTVYVAPQPWLPFHPGIPDERLLPHAEWAKHLETSWARPDSDLLARPDPFGWYPLRQAIAKHLGAWRGLECQPSQVLITSGATEGFEILLSGLLKREAHVTVEDPGWPSLKQLLRHISKAVSPIRVDEHGLNPSLIPKTTDAIIVTPSRHYPTGATMPLARRIELLKLAQTSNAWIIEDDYDSEFRYKGAPLPSLTGLDGLQRTIYMGSFSKLLSPSLRIGYLVIPKHLREEISQVVSPMGSRASLVPQPALAAFMNTGGFARHLRKMRRTYAKRQDHLRDLLEPLKEFVKVWHQPSGMHLMCHLTDRAQRNYDDVELVKRCRDLGLHPRALSAHSVATAPSQGLLLGFAHCNEAELEAAVNRLQSVF